MLSILIPSYNYDVRQLVNDLAKQCLDADILYEILISDDFIQHSETTKALEYHKTDDYKYFHQKENLGRAKNRNFLAEKAQFDNLLFIDADAKVNRIDFIKNYSACFNTKTVVLGGVAYEKTKPSSDKVLRWNFGQSREEIPAEERQQNPYKSFTPFNVLIPKSVFETVQFDETIKTYGHEDTLFGIELNKKEIDVKHIDNSLLHIGLESNDVFIEKTRESVKNLVELYKNNPELKQDLAEQIKLLRVGLKFNVFPLKYKPKFFYKLDLIFLNFIIRKTKSIFFLDIYKFCCFGLYI